MLQIIKDSYHLYFKKFHIWLLFILPLIIYSFLDDYLLAKAAENEKFSFYMTLSLILSPLVYTAIEMFIYRQAMQVKFGKLWGFVKKWVFFIVIQLVMGYVMMIPVFIMSAIAGHHGLPSFWLPAALVINVFLGIWLFAKVCVVLPLIMAGRKVGMREFWTFSRASYVSWLLAAVLVYFPYVAAFYLISCNVANIVVSALLSVIITLFNTMYYQANKDREK